MDKMKVTVKSFTWMRHEHVLIILKVWDWTNERRNWQHHPRIVWLPFFPIWHCVCATEQGKKFKTHWKHLLYRWWWHDGKISMPTNDDDKFKLRDVSLAPSSSARCACLIYHCSSRFCRIGTHTFSLWKFSDAFLPLSCQYSMHCSMELD